LFTSPQHPQNKSVQYVLSFKDVLFDLFALNISMQQHVGMLAC